MIRSLFLPDPNAKQAVRMRRFLLAATTYGTSAGLLVLAWAFKLMALEPAVVLIAAMAVINVTFFFVFRTGFNQRFRDPSLTWGQTFTANIVLMYAIYSFNQGRAFALMIFLVILTFASPAMPW